MFSLGSQKFKHLTWKFSREPRVKKRALLGLCICHWKYNWKDNSEICLPFKTCSNFTTQRFKEGHNWIIVITLSKLVSKVYANISSPDVYWRKRLKHWTHLELCQGSHDTLEQVLNQITSSDSTSWKCSSIEVVKQPEHGRASKQKNKIVPPFRWTMINS